MKTNVCVCVCRAYICKVTAADTRADSLQMEAVMKMRQKAEMCQQTLIKGCEPKQTDTS